MRLLKENKYDDDRFFEEYSRFPRSAEGLPAAGEWPELRKRLPDFRGRRVLDIGCGFGWHCLYAAEQGAARVLGTDISEKMLQVARDKNRFPAIIDYQLAAMEDLNFPDGSFDVVISSLAFHYTPDFKLLSRQIATWLTPGGHFVFSVEHPVFTAAGGQDWLYDDQGQIQCWPVDNYFQEGPRQTVFLGQPVVKYHRTLTSYLESLLTAGFIIRDLVEPQPDASLLARVPGLTDELRRPMMLIVAAQNK